MSAPWRTMDRDGSDPAAKAETHPVDLESKIRISTRGAVWPGPVGCEIGSYGPVVGSEVSVGQLFGLCALERDWRRHYPCQADYGIEG